jgi:predicted nucleic acid-binding protein
MPVSHLLDTSVYCQPMKPKPLASLEKRWRSLGDESLATSIICDAEILYGLALKESDRLNSLHAELLKDRLTVLPVDTSVAMAFGELKAACRRKGFSASDFDFLIAATAKAHGLILATINVRHFKGIDGLAVEDWSF